MIIAAHYAAITMISCHYADAIDIFAIAIFAISCFSLAY
jgi:hypothetical protein